MPTGRTRVPALLSVLWLLTACGAAETSKPAATPPAPVVAPTTPAAAPTTPADPQIARAQAAIAELRGRLKARLTDAMAKGGAEAALRVCAEEAGPIREAVAKEMGVTVGRSSLRLRSAKDAAPAWVADWLQRQGERPAEGVTGLAERAGSPPVAHVLEPIRIDPPCLVCHGPKDQLAPGVAAVLAERYPQDEATGYALGDLRGAFWAEVKGG